MSTAHYCRLRSSVEYCNAAAHDGRLGYWPDRSRLQVSTAHGDLSRLWRLRDFGPLNDRDPNSRRRVTLEAVDTAVPGMPNNPDGFRYWAHQPLMLTVTPEGEVVLGGVGRGLAPEAHGFWAADCQVRQDPAGGPRRLLALRLQPAAWEGRYLAHQRDGAAPGSRLARPTSDLTLGTPGDDGTHDMWWYVEIAPAPACLEETAAAV